MLYWRALLRSQLVKTRLDKDGQPDEKAQGVTDLGLVEGNDME